MALGDPVTEVVASVEPDKVVTEKRIDSNNIVRNAYHPSSDIIPPKILNQVQSKADDKLETPAEVVASQKKAEDEKDASSEFLDKRDEHLSTDRNVGPISDGPEKEKINAFPVGATRSADEEEEQKKLAHPEKLRDPTLPDESKDSGGIFEFPDTTRKPDSKPLSDFDINKGD